MRRGGAKSFVDDLVLGRGVVLSRAATSLRSIETQPWTRRFVCFLDRQIIPGSPLLLFFSPPPPSLSLPLPRARAQEGGRKGFLFLLLLSLLRLKGQTFSLGTVQLRLKGETFREKKRAARVRGGSNWDSLKE